MAIHPDSARLLRRSDITDPAGPLTAAFGGRNANRVVTMGDSITAGSDSWMSTGESWPTYAAINSNQRFHVVHNAGVGGNTTTQMVARFAADVNPYAPSVVTIMGGANDYATDVTKATWQANIISMVASTRALNAAPVLCTLAPTESATYKQTIADWNQWLRAYAGANRIPLIDFYKVLVDPADRTYLAAYLGDGVHPNSAGYAAMGNLVATQLAPTMPLFAVPSVMSSGDTNNAMDQVNPLFTNTGLGGDGEANITSGTEYWYMTNPSQATSAVVTGDAALKGNWHKRTFATLSTADSHMYCNHLPFTGRTGHVVAFTGRIKTALTTAGGIIFNAAFSDGASDPLILYTGQLSQNLDGTFWIQGTVPAGIIYLNLGFMTKAGTTGTVSMGQLAVLDLTAMGVDTLV